MADRRPTGYDGKGGCGTPPPPPSLESEGEGRHTHPLPLLELFPNKKGGIWNTRRQGKKYDEKWKTFLMNRQKFLVFLTKIYHTKSFSNCRSYEENFWDPKLVLPSGGYRTLPPYPRGTPKFRQTGVGTNSSGRGQQHGGVTVETIASETIWLANHQRATDQRTHGRSDQMARRTAVEVELVVVHAGDVSEPALGDMPWAVDELPRMVLCIGGRGGLRGSEEG